ncbi:MAG: beta-galactosidase [bacterium]|nr:beta-galactosidase [bacterium]
MARTTREIRIRQQLRGFVVIWAGITFIMGAVTFIAIYMAYGQLNDTRFGGTLRNMTIPETAQSIAQVAQPTIQLTTPTALPTRDPALAQAAAPTDLAPTNPPPATATALPVDVRRFQLGVQVQISYDLMDQWMDVAANQLDVNWVKQQVRWELIEPERDTYDWVPLDIYLPAAQRQGLKVLISVVTAPAWAREPGANLERHGPPADPQDYADFVTAILDRYPGMVHAVEVWNEQNLDREWTSTEGLVAANYVELLRTSYQAIKAVDPGVIVVSGALSPTGVSDGIGAWDDFVYMDQMIEAGLLNYADCIGAHHNGINVSPDYTSDAVPNDPTAIFRGPFDNPHHSWSFRSTLQTYASKVSLAGGDQRLCVTEFGWASAEGLDGVPEGFGFAQDNTLEEQRDFTVAALENMVEWDIVQLAILWNLNYGPQAGWDANNDNVPYSIIGPGFQFRPVFDAVRDWNRTYEAQFQ